MIQRLATVHYNIIHISKFIIILFFTVITSTISLAFISGGSAFSDIKMTINFLEFFVLMFVVSHLIQNKQDVHYYLLCFALITLGVTIFTVAKSLGLPIPGFTRIRHAAFGPFYIGVVAFMENVLGYSIMLCATIPLLHSNMLLRSIYVKLILIVLCSIGALLLYTRSLYLALIIQFMSFAFLYLFVIKKHPLYRFIFGFNIFLFIVLTFSLWDVIWDTFFVIRQSTIESRIFGYQNSITAATSSASNFFLGIGKSYYVDYLTYDGAVPHNFFIEILLSKGLLTLTLMIAFFSTLILALTQLIRTSQFDDQKRAAVSFLIGVIGILIVGMFGPITCSLILWTFLSIVCSYVSVAKRMIGDANESHVFTA